MGVLKMGKPKKTEGKTITMYLKGDELHIQDRLENLAENIGISRNQLTINLLKMALEEAELVDRTGVFRLVTMFGQMRKGTQGKIVNSVHA
jgi:hypothetical protein